MSRFEQAPPLSLYIHLPWCIRKCPYCDFNSHATEGEKFPEQAYNDALIRDLDFALQAHQDRTIISIFIGGGTPSLFSAEGMKSLLAAVFSRIQAAPDIEVTLEANPGSVDSSRFAAFREAGINRLSIGIQSFDNGMLRRLGRIHDGDAAMKAIITAKTVGFNRFNLDLMYGLPSQSAVQAMEDLSRAISYGPRHLSWYQLTIEPNTVFYKQPPLVPVEDEIWAMQEQGQALLEASGFKHYEISAYATTAQECKHNLNYWEFGDYIGIGAGAHSKLTDISQNQIARYVRHRLPERYIELAGHRSVVTESKLLTEADSMLEFMMNSLRLPGGFSISLFEQRTGLPVNKLLQATQIPVDKGWLEVKGTQIKPTRTGQNYLNDLLQCFMPDTEVLNNHKHIEMA